MTGDADTGGAVLDGSRRGLTELDEDMKADTDNHTLAVYVPASNSKLVGQVWRGSGIVGSPVGDTGRLRLDFEGAAEIYPSYADRVERAAERHQAARPGGGRGYPSRASAHVDPDQVIEVGRWDLVAGELTITDPERVNAWLEQ